MADFLSFLLACFVFKYFLAMFVSAALVLGVAVVMYLTLTLEILCC